MSGWVWVKRASPNVVSVGDEYEQNGCRWRVTRVFTGASPGTHIYQAVMV